MMYVPELVGISLLLYLLYKYVLYPAFLSPLSKVPKAHWSSSISSIWILWKRYVGAENESIHAAHEKHGPIVRLGPNDINVNCVDGGIKTLGAFEKPDWYPNAFFNYGLTNMFSMKDSKTHALRRRLLSNSYSKSHLQSSPELHQIALTILFTRYIPVLDSLANSACPVEVHELNFATTMDFINAYIFGLRNGSNFIQDVETRKHLLHIYQCRRPYIFYPQEVPIIFDLLKRLRLNIVPAWADAATEEFEAFGLRMCTAASKTLTSASLITPSNTPVVYRTLLPLLPDPKTTSPSPPSPTLHKSNEGSLSIASELLDHLAAGHETSGITLTYALYRLSQNPSLQRSLRTELLTLSPPIIYAPPSSDAEPELPSPRQIDALPLLHAILQETLRLHAAIPGPQPRETPQAPTSLAGSPPLPGGVRVSAQAYSLHRNPEVFPEPEVWRPKRWMEGTNEQRTEMGRWFWAFGSGGRMCVGRHFAVQEMKLILAAIYTNFSTSIVDDTGIEMIDAYVSRPKSNQLILRFERVQ